MMLIGRPDDVSGCAA